MTTIKQLSVLLSLLFLGATALEKDDNRMIAYMGNWQACPSAAQLNEYTHVIVAFAVSYTWSPGKNSCSNTCYISTPVICNNAPNPTLINQLHQAGKKVILSFGGAGMGGSWAGDNNDCWEYCFGRETQVVDRLVDIVNQNNFDGVDIDYEYFYENNQHNSGFTKGAQAIKFLKDVTVGLRNKLPAGSIITHAPMDADLVEGTAYYNMLKSISYTLDFIMPQYYNGYTRAAIDGFSNSGAGQMAASEHYKSLLDNFFNGDVTRMVFGFCINDCGATGSNANGAQSADVMRQIGNIYDCHGGAFFWVLQDDASGTWSSTVNAVMAPDKGCSSRNPSTPTPSGSTTAPELTLSPVTASPVSSSDGGSDPDRQCCPEGKSFFRAFGKDCSKFYYCLNGVAVDDPTPCPQGLMYDELAQVCNWPALTICDQNRCDGVEPEEMPTSSPTTSPTFLPSTRQVEPEPTSTTSPTETSTTEEEGDGNDCCPPGKSFFRAHGEDCSHFYYCLNGKPADNPIPCPDGLIYDEVAQSCNWPALTFCDKNRCGGETPQPTSSPTKPSTESPTAQVSTISPTDSPTESHTKDSPTDSPTPSPGMCCDPGKSEFHAFGDDCKHFYYCLKGKAVGIPSPCPTGLIYDEDAQSCNWPALTTCSNRCGSKDGEVDEPTTSPTRGSLRATMPPTSPDPRVEDPSPPPSCGSASVCGTDKWFVYSTRFGQCRERCVDSNGVKRLTTPLRGYVCGTCAAKTENSPSLLQVLFDFIFNWNRKS